MLRIASADDLAALADLERGVFGDDAWGIESLRGLFDESTLVLVEARESGANPTLLAYAAFRCVVDEAELLRVAVRTEARRRGLGRKLLERGAAELGHRGVETCHLEVRADNVAARGLYAVLGFEPVGRRSAYYRDGSDAELWTLALSDGDCDVDGDADNA